MSMKILPYRMYSKSAKELARAIGVLRIRSPHYRQRRKEMVINWGNSNPTQNLITQQVINKPEAVRKASNKLTTLKVLRDAGVGTLEFTERAEEAAGWLTDGFKVVCRKILNGHSGQGIEIIEEGEVPYAPLYTKYERKDAEYRVHVVRGEVIDFVRKKKRNGYADDASRSPYIRTHAHGWVFCRGGVECPAVVQSLARDAVRVLGLDFGAVDVGAYGGQAFVLEVNTAPGLEGTTLQKYVEAFKKLTRQPLTHYSSTRHMRGVNHE